MPDAVVVAAPAAAQIGQDLVVAVRVHLDHGAGSDPGVIDPPDGPEAAVVAWLRKAGIEDLDPEAARAVPRLQRAGEEARAGHETRPETASRSASVG